MKNFGGYTLVSDQVEPEELAVIIRELNRVVKAGVEGDVVELGCYEGTTSLFLQRTLKQFSTIPRIIPGNTLQDDPTDQKPFQGLSLERRSARNLWLYDSFAGLPDKSSADSSPAGLQFKTGELHASKQQLIMNFKKAGLPLPKVKKAWFSELVPSDLPEKICFAFLDGDYYQSIMDSLKLIWPLLANGAVVIVDDYLNEALPGAAKAVDEWCKQLAVNTMRVEQSLAILSKE